MYAEVSNAQAASLMEIRSCRFSVLASFYFAFPLAACNTFQGVKFVLASLKLNETAAFGMFARAFRLKQLMCLVRMFPSFLVAQTATCILH